MTDTELKIDDGVPIPPLHTQSHDARRALFKRLQVDQSIFYPGEKIEALRMALAKWALHEGFTITTRKVEEDGVAGLRVWRVE
jgi:hypothetical protein